MIKCLSGLPLKHWNVFYKFYDLATLCSNALNYHKCWFSHLVMKLGQLLWRTKKKKKLELCTLISSSIQGKSTLDPEGLPGRPARHKLMQAFQELYKMTHIGLSWLLEIPSNSHFTMQFLTKVSQSVNTWVKREHSSRYSRESLRTKPNNTSKGVFFFLKGARLWHRARARVQS